MILGIRRETAVLIGALVAVAARDRVAHDLQTPRRRRRRSQQLPASEVESEKLRLALAGLGAAIELDSMSPVAQPLGNSGGTRGGDQGRLDSAIDHHGVLLAPGQVYARRRPAKTRDDARTGPCEPGCGCVGEVHAPDETDSGLAGATGSGCADTACRAGTTCGAARAPGGHGAAGMDYASRGRAAAGMDYASRGRAAAGMDHASRGRGPAFDPAFTHA